MVDRADVAVHAEDAVGDDELAAGLVFDFLQQLFAVSDVFVAEDFDFCLRQARAVDDAGVVEFVGENEIFLAEDGADSARVGGESALEDDAGFDILEARDFFFELHVDLHGAGDGADGSGADAEFARRFQSSFAEARVRGQSEIVVAGEVDDALAVVGADRFLLVVQHAELEVGAARFQVVELLGEVAELGTSGGRGGHCLLLMLQRG